MQTVAPTFPFAAVVGQPTVKLALTLLAIDPRIGGVCISGPRGAAKSTLARSLADLMPKGKDHFVTLPLGASEEMVIGTLDLQHVFDQQTVSLQPGLVQLAHDGVLYVDEVNLLADNLVDILLDVTASGINTVERDGIRKQHEARFVFIGTMNPDEGELRPQLLDRFALSASLQTDYSLCERMDIVRRREAFDYDAEVFCADYQPQQRALARKIAEARTRLTTVECNDALREIIAERCVAAAVDGMRADIVWIKSAKTHAAWQSRTEVIVSDLDAVEALVLHHRRQTPKNPDNQPAPKTFSRPEKQHETAASGEQNHAEGDWGGMPPMQQLTAEKRCFEVNTAPLNQSINPLLRRSMSDRKGQCQETTKPDWCKTLAENKGIWPLSQVYFKQSQKTTTLLHMVLLDTSASTLGHQLFAQAKGLVASIAEQVYLARQKIALIGFGNQQVVELLSKRRAPKEIRSLLDTVTAGGGTPLREALLYIQSYCKKLLRTDAAIQFIHYIITDGRSRDDIADLDLPGKAILIDTEMTSVKHGRSAEIAMALNAQYIELATVTGRGRW